MSSTREKIKVMQAFDKGIGIEKRNIVVPNPPWVDETCPTWDWYNFEFRIKQKWYDNIKESGCLCWVSDTDRSLKIRASVIKKRDKEGVFYCDDKYQVWNYATPLTHDEIEVFMSACYE